MKHQTDEDLSSLLKALFDSDGLRRWIHQYLGEDAYQELSEAEPLAELAFRAARLIEQRGRVDSALWASLERVRPHQRVRIRAFARGSSGSGAISSAPWTRRFSGWMLVLGVLASGVAGVVLARVFTEPVADPGTDTSYVNDAGSPSRDMENVETAPPPPMQAAVVVEVDAGLVGEAVEPEAPTPSAKNADMPEKPPRVRRRRRAAAPSERAAVARDAPTSTEHVAPEADTAPTSNDAVTRPESARPVTGRADTSIDLTGGRVGKRARVRTGNVTGEGKTGIKASGAEIDDDAIVETGDADNR